MHDPFLQEIREKFRSSSFVVVLSGNSKRTPFSVWIFAPLLAAFRRCCSIFLVCQNFAARMVPLSSARRDETNDTNFQKMTSPPLGSTFSVWAKSDIVRLGLTRRARSERGKIFLTNFYVLKISGKYRKCTAKCTGKCTEVKNSTFCFAEFRVESGTVELSSPRRIERYPIC